MNLASHVLIFLTPFVPALVLAPFLWSKPHPSFKKAR